MSTELIPPDHLIKSVGSTPADFVTVGRHCFDLLLKYGGLKPTDRVLDVGCGCGRSALPLTSYLTTGSYEGFDIVAESVRWCADNITPRWPRFKFQHADVFNDFYNPSSATKAKDFRFPYADDCFDLTFLTSVFTHMLPEDVAGYTREIARTLKPGGRAVITFFVINEESLRLQHATDAILKFVYSHAGAFVVDPIRPEVAVAYGEESALRLLQDNKLTPREVYFGQWCGRKDGPSYQDLVVCDKR